MLILAFTSLLAFVAKACADTYCIKGLSNKTLISCSVGNSKEDIVVFSHVHNFCILLRMEIVLSKQTKEVHWTTSSYLSSEPRCSIDKDLGHEVSSLWKVALFKERLQADIFVNHCRTVCHVYTRQ